MSACHDSGLAIEYAAIQVGPMRHQCLNQYISHISALSKLQSLRLVGCNVSCLPSSIDRLVYLQELDLAGCQFESFPDAVTRLGALTMVDISNNERLVSIPEGLMRACMNQTSLDLTFLPRLTHLPDSTTLLVNLCDLLLNGNETLQRLPAGLGALLRLCYIDLQGCWRLADLPVSLTAISNLELDVRQCHGLQCHIQDCPLYDMLSLWLEGNFLLSTKSLMLTLSCTTV